MQEVTATELSHLGIAYRELADEFASALRGHAATDPMPQLDWSVGQLGQHVLAGARDYRRALAGRRVWESFDGPTENLRALEGVPERDTADIADALPEAVDQLLDAVAHAGPEPRSWLGDVRIPAATMLHVVFADTLVHRWDLERVSYRSADKVLAPSFTHLALAAPLRVAPHFLTPAGEAAEIVFELRIRGGATYRLEFHGGALAVEQSVAPDADCRLSATPQAFMLVGYGRRTVANATARGTMMAFGRKPWLGLQFPSLLRNP